MDRAPHRFPPRRLYNPQKLALAPVPIAKQIAEALEAAHEQVVNSSTCSPTER